MPHSLERIIAGISLIVLSPLFALVTAAIKLDSRGPVFYRGRRLGRHGGEFRVFKFRSMQVGSDRRGPGITTAGDARVTRVGRWLRLSKIDELPQLLNVLRGEMSLVGPRPEDPRYLSFYSPDQKRVLQSRPGITSPASIAFRHEERLLEGEDWESRYVRQVLPAKLELELKYAENRSLWTDLQILIKTVVSLFKKGDGSAPAERQSRT